MAATSERDALLSGGAWHAASGSTRAGFIPVALSRVPVSALRGIPVYIRVRPDPKGAPGASPESAFRLYCGREIPCTSARLARLVQNNVRFLYIRISDHERFRQQTEECIQDTAADGSVAAITRSAIVYETSVELINEVLSTPDMREQAGRVANVAKAVATLVIDDPQAFSHLFAASHHDFYTATHMVNVGTWMVSLACAMGTTDPEELGRICQAGMLHDMGKLSVPQSLLNKKGPLTPREWALLRSHAEEGYKYLSRFETIDPLIPMVAHQHHERMDGSGYPLGLKGPEIHPISRMCAVIDSFDAMTAVRPFKTRCLTPAESLQVIRAETPVKYDPVVVAAWCDLAARAEAPRMRRDPAPQPLSRRHVERRDMNCPGRVHELVVNKQGVRARASMPIIAHNISDTGLGFLCQFPIKPGQLVRVFLDSEGWRSRRLEGRTVRCRSHTDRWHEIGIVFCDPRAEVEPVKLKDGEKDEEVKR